MSKILEVERLLVEVLGNQGIYADPVIASKIEDALRLLRESFTEEEEMLEALLEGWDNATLEPGMNDAEYGKIIKGFGLDDPK